MDPQFQRALIAAVVGGTVMFGVGVLLLVLVFRSFEEGRAALRRQILTIGALVSFIFACCLLLYFWSAGAYR